MAELSPAIINSAILVVGALLYAFIWYATGDLSRFAKVLARLAPLGLLIPALIYVSMLSAPRQAAMAPQPAPEPTGRSYSRKPVEDRGATQK